MSREIRDNNLIFLISQPRAGSTLLQRILGSHPDIHTVSEPWLLLPPVYALKENGYQAENNAFWAQKALESFLDTIPNGQNEYFCGVQKMFAHLYGKALSCSGKNFFLDKTPRYYLIIPEIMRIFPEAHFVILLRNPLAVLCSIINSWSRENWFTLNAYKDDLILAPKLLLEGIEQLGNQAIIVHYEQLVKDPETNLQNICNRLGIEYRPDIIQYSQANLPHWVFGDQGIVYNNKEPAVNAATAWTQALRDPQVWRLAKDYLEALDTKSIARMGYVSEELEQALEDHQPSLIRRKLTFPLAWLLLKPVRNRKAWERMVVEFVRKLRVGGIPQRPRITSGSSK